MEKIALNGRVEGGTVVPTTRGRTITLPVVLIMLYIVAEYPKPVFLVPFRPALLVQVALFILLAVNVEKVQGVLKDKFFILFGVLLAEMAVHGPTASNNHWALMQFLLMLTYLIIALSMVVFLDTKEKLIAVLGFFVVIHMGIGLERLLPGRRSHFGVTGVLGDKNDLAAAMNAMIPLAFFMGLSRRGSKRAFFWGCVIVFILTNISSASRGGFIGMVSVALFIFLKSKHKIRAFIILIIAIIALSFLAPQNYKREIRSIVTEGSESGTGRQRVELWKIAWKTFLDNPIIGVGQGNLPWVYEEYQDWNNLYWHRGVGGKVVHSMYFTVLSELGIVGFGIFSIMFFDLYRKCIFQKEDKLILSKFEWERDPKFSSFEHYQNGLFGGIVGFLVSGIFLSSFYYPQFWNMAGLITASWIQRSKMIKAFSNQIEDHPNETQCRT